nr:hypothetical protein [uncultured Sellimonas sp.]
MKKVLIIFIVVVLILVAGIGGFVYLSNRNGNSRVTNDKAEKDEKNRYLTIINGTNQVINEVHITVGEGSEIEHSYQENPDENSFSVKIPKQYDEYKEFVVTLIDRYGLKYEKKVTDIKENGRTEVKITEDDYTKQKGDTKRKIDQFFNGD